MFLSGVRQDFISHAYVTRTTTHAPVQHPVFFNTLGLSKNESEPGLSCISESAAVHAVHAHAHTRVCTHVSRRDPWG